MSAYCWAIVLAWLWRAYRDDLDTDIDVCPAVTADRVWANVDVGVEVIAIR